MSFLFKRAKTPAELLKSTRDAIIRLDREPDKKKINDEVSRDLMDMKKILLGDGGDPNPEAVSQLAQEVYQHDFLQLLVSKIGLLEFEARKDAVQIFNQLLKRQIGARYPTAEHIATRERILFTLIDGYNQPDVALNCGGMLRECIRHEPLARAILYSPHFWRFFSYVELSTFDIASDAFATFRDLLSKHKGMVAEFLTLNYDKVFEQYTKLLTSENYVTKRQSLKLLGELLLERANFNVMTRYISNPENLKLMMNLLRDPSRNIQLEAFHVFKVFVANPNKPKPILDILRRNKDKLITFLTAFHKDRTDDDQFMEEKAFLIKQMTELPLN